MSEIMNSHCLTVIFLWGMIATCAMACLQEGTHAFGFSRMSFPFIMGTFFTRNRYNAEFIGFLLYFCGGWLFASLYVWIFSSLGQGTALLGAGFGLCQGIFMLVVLLPLLPSIHPRMSSPYDGPTSARQIEPPGFMALNYGARTPFIHLAGQIVFGAIIGAVY